MEVIYQIHTYFEHCNVNFDGKIYSYDSLKKILNEETKEFSERHKNISKTKPNSKTSDLKYDGRNFDNSNLTVNEIKEYLFFKKQSKAKSWISSQRRKRREGRLTQIQVENLNRLGMVWNPTTDEWEKNYNLYRTDRLMEVLKSIKDSEVGCGGHWIERFKQLGEWINEQNELYEQDNLSKENLARLKAVDFPFKSTLERKTSIQLNVLLLSCQIRNLKSELSSFGWKKFIKHYGLKQKAYVGSKIKISEEVVLKKKEKEKLKYNQQSFTDEKKWNRQHEEIAEKELDKLVTKSDDDFLKLIDTISTYGPLTWGSKNNYYLGDKGREIPIYINKYHDIYLELENFIKDRFVAKSEIKHYEYSFTLKFEFKKGIKIYAAKKMILLLDKHLIKSGILNNQKKIEPISFLLNVFLKEKNREGIIELKTLIESHELLYIIYKKKLMRIYNKII